MQSHRFGDRLGASTLHIPLTLADVAAYSSTLADVVTYPCALPPSVSLPSLAPPLPSPPPPNISTWRALISSWRTQSTGSSSFHSYGSVIADLLSDYDFYVVDDIAMGKILTFLCTHHTYAYLYTYTR